MLDMHGSRDLTRGMISNEQSQLCGSRRDGVFIAAGVVWVIVYGAVLFFLKQPGTPPVAKIALALVPMIPFAVFVMRYIGYLRGLDELHRRVHLEALVFAFPLAMLLLMTLGLMERGNLLSGENWSYRHVWYYLPFFYLLGITISWRRYR